MLFLCTLLLSGICLGGQTYIEKDKGSSYFGHHHPNTSLSSLHSAGRPHPRGAAGAGEYPPAQAGAAGGHSGNTGRGYEGGCKFVYTDLKTHKQ